MMDHKEIMNMKEIINKIMMYLIIYCKIICKYQKDKLFVLNNNTEKIIDKIKI